MLLHLSLTALRSTGMPGVLPPAATAGCCQPRTHAACHATHDIETPSLIFPPTTQRSRVFHFAQTTAIAGCVQRRLHAPAASTIRLDNRCVKGLVNCIALLPPFLPSQLRERQIRQDNATLAKRLG